MAITYPRQLPDNLRMQEAWIDLIDPVSMQPSKNLINISQVVEPYWQGKFVTPPLEHLSEQPLWSAWNKSLRMSRTFIAFDVRRKTPLAYQSAKVPTDIAGAWAGTCVVSSLGTSGALGLSSLPLATYQFKVGDRIGLEQSGKYGYYEVLEDVVASGSAATVTVSPFLHTTLFTTSAVARLWRPWCQFIMDKTSWSEQGTVEKQPISFQGTQRL